MHKTDFLVIGSGLAGLSFAIKTALRFPDKKVTVVTKASGIESNTRYAQGGVAVVTDFINDNFDQHKKDTLIAGDGLCDEEIVEIVVTEGPARLDEIIQYGAAFDKTEDGEFHLGIEGAHSAPRILHHRDVTGFEIQKTLVDKATNLSNIEILENHFAVDLITQHHLDLSVKDSKQDLQCFGAYVMDADNHATKTFSAPITVMASGGIGQVYKMTTNPPVATGDGIAMAYRAKALINHMQFVQFHPTALYGHEGERAFLISEAVRGFGAILRRRNGISFMDEYDERGSLASRDIVSRAIDTEMKARGEEYVYLDCRHLDQNEFKSHFPNIYAKCSEVGLDLTKDMIPVAPAAHYLCGGVVTDEHGQTSIKNLYACGEIACTGLHGANRLASNSLLEAFVFAHRCYEDVVKNSGESIPTTEIPDWDIEGTNEPKEWVLINHNREELRKLMTNYVGIVRSDERLKRSLSRLRILYKETETLYKTTTISPQLCELRNLINVANLIITQSMNQKENKGTYFNIDIKS